MKKFFTTSLAVAMAAATLGTTAFAADAGSKTLNSTNGYSHEIAVNGIYTEYQKSDEIISVDVEWEAMSFTYAAAQQGTWNPSTHEYDNATTKAGWVDDSADITVTNHSNVDVTATFAFEAAANYNAVTGTFCQGYKTDDESKINEVELDAGTVADGDGNGGYDNADKEKVTFVIGGSLDEATTPNTELTFGTITVSVAKK